VFPFQNLIDSLEGGDSIEDFLDGFPSVSREQVMAFLEEAKRDIEAGRLITNEEMKARLGEWSDSGERQGRKAAR
jgi:predicted transcriptional regulator